jgi:hypothetical protein
VRNDVAHVVPHALCKDVDRERSPFDQLVRALLPTAYAQQVWDYSGGENVNKPTNFMVLACQGRLTVQVVGISSGTGY